MTIDNAFEMTAQFAHALFGVLCVVITAYLFNNPYYGYSVLFIWALGKEFWYDPNYETPEISGGWAGNVRDFMWYNVGAALGYGVWWLHGLIT
ncbi:MAG TPA: hypothetical protein VEP90_14315 [Methylomirabilota bacterium]|nr:hypothetical protein [Methylomirabilota bacterium]